MLNFNNQLNLSISKYIDLYNILIDENIIWK